MGPGLVYAGAAIGVSHLVQSTRAGANYGFELLVLIPIINFIKWPFFELGPRIATEKKHSLLVAYHQLSPVYSFVFMLVTLMTMFIIQGAISVVTAGIALNVFGVPLDFRVASVSVLFIAGVMLWFSRYHLFDRIIKYIVVFLAMATILSVVILLFRIEPGSVSSQSTTFFNLSNVVDLAFLIAFLGWMPAPMDVPVWQSLWTIEKKKVNKQYHFFFDFWAGFLATIVMAGLFLTLGALVMHHKGVVFETSAIAFSAQLIELFTSSLGLWSFPLIAFACLATMFSTTLTCFDAFPRVFAEYYENCLQKKNQNGKKVYRIFLIITFFGTCIINVFFVTSLKSFVDFATTISFLTSPVLAFFSFQVFRKTVKLTNVYFKLQYCVYVLGLIFFILLSLYYLYTKL